MENIEKIGLYLVFILGKSGLYFFIKKTSSISQPLETNEVNSSPLTTPSQKAKECSCQKNVELMTEEISACIRTHCKSRKDYYESKIPGDEEDPLKIDVTSMTLDDLYDLSDSTLAFMQKGGWWSPDDCQSDHHVAIIIPVRDRYDQLSILLRHLLPLLKQKNKHFRVFVIEQNEKHSFNKGKLLNIGFKESQKYFPYTFVFHDVDLLAESPQVMYGCEESPTHVSTLLDTFNYKLIYNYMFTGVQMFTKQDYEEVNGFSNSFWHKGGEDDNLYDRTDAANLVPFRQWDEAHSKFTHVKHKASKWSGSESDTPFQIDGKSTGKGMDEFRKGLKEHSKTDGLSNLVYEVVDKKERRLYTNIKVDLQKTMSHEFGIFTYGKDDVWTKVLKEIKAEQTKKDK